MIWKRRSLQTPFLASDDPSVPPTNACGHLVNQVAAFLSEAPKAFHREGGEFIAALAEGHLSRSRLVAALARLIIGSSQPVSVIPAAVASRRPPLSITISIRKSLSALKGAPFSTWWRIDIRLSVRKSVCTRGWRWLTCAPNR